MPSIAVAMVQPNGSRSASVPLSERRPMLMGNSPASCHIVLPRSAVKQKVSLESVKGNSSKALFRDCMNAEASPKLLGVNDEFTMSGKTFRVVAMDGEENNNKGTPTAAHVKLQMRKQTPFVASRTVAFRGDVDSPKIQPRKPSTPFVPSSNRVQFFENSPAAAQVQQKLKFKLAEQEEEEEEKQVLPNSVLKFMASRAKKNTAAPKAVTRGKPFVPAPVAAPKIATPKVVVTPKIATPKTATPKAVITPKTATPKQQMRKAPTPLRQEIQLEGQRLNQLRTELLSQLEDYGLDTERYAMWTVAQLEQRVEALDMEHQRASVEALLIEAGYDPREFEEYDVEEIEAWLEEEISMMQEEEEEPVQRKQPVTFQGKVTEFASPGASFMQSNNSFAHHSSPAVPEPSFVQYVEQDAFCESSLDGSPSFIQEHAAQQEENVFDEEESVLSPIAKRTATVETPFSVKKLVTTPYFKRIAAEEMTCEKIRAELKQRGLKVGGLKSVIAERLAEALENEALGKGMEIMEDSGHAYIGRAVERVFETGVSRGVIVAWAPPPVGEVDESLSRFRVEHENGEVEVLDLEETEQALLE